MAYLHTNYPQSCRKLKLSTAENLLLLTVRLWVVNQHNQRQSLNHWYDGLMIAGLSNETVKTFNQLLSLLNGLSARRLQFHYPVCSCIGNDEGLLLEIFALLQLKQFESTKEILGYWLPPQVVPLAIPPARNLASALVAEGLFVPIRNVINGGNTADSDFIHYPVEKMTVN